MAIDDALNKAKDALAKNQDAIKDQARQHADKVAETIDSVSQKAQDIAPDQADGAIAGAADKAKEAFGSWVGTNDEK